MREETSDPFTGAVLQCNVQDGRRKGVVLQPLQGIAIGGADFTRRPASCSVTSMSRAIRGSSSTTSDRVVLRIEKFVQGHDASAPYWARVANSQAVTAEKMRREPMRLGCAHRWMRQRTISKRAS